MLVAWCPGTRTLFPWKPKIAANMYKSDYYWVTWKICMQISRKSFLTRKYVSPNFVNYAQRNASWQTSAGVTTFVFVKFTRIWSWSLCAWNLNPKTKRNFHSILSSYCVNWEVFKDIVCGDALPSCYLLNCKNCPGTARYCEKLRDSCTDHSIKEVNFKKWVQTDRYTLDYLIFRKRFDRLIF